MMVCRGEWVIRVERAGSNNATRSVLAARNQLVVNMMEIWGKPSPCATQHPTGIVRNGARRAFVLVIHREESVSHA